MKVRKKKQPRYKVGEYPAKGTPEYEELTPSERRLAQLRKPFQPGQSGNPLGKKPGSGSVVVQLRKALRGPAKSRRYETCSEELSAVMVQKARRGNAAFMSMILDKTENKAMTREDIDMIIERVYNLFIYHVKDEQTRSKIASSMLALKLQEDE